MRLSAPAGALENSTRPTAAGLSLIHIFPILNVYENIVLPVELDGDTVDQKFLDEIVHLLGLEDKLKKIGRASCRERV